MFNFLYQANRQIIILKMRKSSYQKLKENNTTLIQALYKLTMRDVPVVERMEVEMYYRMIFEMENQVWSGSHTKK